MSTGHCWGYSGQHGPTSWCHVAPAAKGLHQSPVDIVTDDVEFEAKLSSCSIRPHYVPASCHSLVNTGHSVQVAVDGGRGAGYLSSWLEGGPCRHRYQLEQFHFHWGTASNNGSEHLVDGEGYASELHLVHWNTDLFSSFNEAAKSANGLVVLAVFLKVGNEHRYFKKLTDLIPRVSYRDEKVSIPGGFDPTVLLPADRSKYYTYSGSLTTPPCYESVRFVVFSEPVEISLSQLNQFRRVNSVARDENKNDKFGRADQSGGRITCNCRPVQPLYDRKILASFPKLES